MRKNFKRSYEKFRLARFVKSVNLKRKIRIFFLESLSKSSYYLLIFGQESKFFLPGGDIMKRSIIYLFIIFLFGFFRVEGMQQKGELKRIREIKLEQILSQKDSYPEQLNYFYLTNSKTPKKEIPLCYKFRKAINLEKTIILLEILSTADDQTIIELLQDIPESSLDKLIKNISECLFSKIRDTTNNYKETLIHYLTQNIKDADIAMFLLYIIEQTEKEYIKEKNNRLLFQILKQQDIKGNTVLHNLIQHGNTELFDRILKTKTLSREETIFLLDQKNNTEIASYQPKLD